MERKTFYPDGQPGVECEAARHAPSPAIMQVCLTLQRSCLDFVDGSHSVDRLLRHREGGALAGVNPD